MGAVSTSKKSSAGKNVLVFFIVFIILEMLIIFGIGKVFKNKDVTPSVMGYSLFITNEDLVQNDSSGAAQVVVPKNVLVIASDGLPDPHNKIGCAILCENIKGVGAGVYWLADITSEDGVNGVDFTVTNGSQAYVVKSSNIVGVCSSYFVTAGKVIGFVTQKFGMICCAVVPLFLLVLIELIIAIATHSSDDDEDEDDEEDEDKSVELDDFLFGGQSEGEQIAKRRRRSGAAAEKKDDEDDKRERPAKSAAAAERDEPVKKADDEDDFDFDAKRPSVKEAAAAAEAEKPAAEEIAEPKEETAAEQDTEKAEEKADDKAADEETVPETAAQKPARRQGSRPAAARRRRPASSVNTGDASLEELMKLMEEEQNKLRNKMN